MDLRRLYLDANAIIYSVEGPPGVRAAVVTLVERVEALAGRVVTSRLSLLECRVKPLRERDDERLSLYAAFFAKAVVEVAELTPRVVELTTDLRARHGFKTPDALHLATALSAEVDVFATGDRALARCPGIQVAVLDPASREP